MGVRRLASGFELAVVSGNLTFRTTRSLSMVCLDPLCLLRAQEWACPYESLLDRLKSAWLMDGSGAQLCNFLGQGLRLHFLFPRSFYGKSDMSSLSFLAGQSVLMILL